MELGKSVRGLREIHGWTQQELAYRAGVTQSMIAHLEAGKHPNPRRTTLAGLAAAFDMTIDELISFSGADQTIALPDPVYELQVEGLPSWVVKDLARMWPDLTADDQQSIIDLTRTIWERRRRGRTQKQQEAREVTEP